MLFRACNRGLTARRCRAVFAAAAAAVTAITDVRQAIKVTKPVAGRGPWEIYWWMTGETVMPPTSLRHSSPTCGLRLDLPPSVNFHTNFTPRVIVTGNCITQGVAQETDSSTSRPCAETFPFRTDIFIPVAKFLAFIQYGSTRKPSAVAQGTIARCGGRSAYTKWISRHSNTIGLY